MASTAVVSALQEECSSSRHSYRHLLPAGHFAPLPSLQLHSNRDIIGCQTANQQFNWTGDFRLESPQQRHRDDPRIYIGMYNGQEAVARKLTPQECLKLMGFENFKIVVPDHIMYRQAGNSIAVPVLKSIIKEILGVL